MKKRSLFFISLLILNFCGSETIERKQDIISGDFYYDIELTGEKKLSFVTKEDDFNQNCENVNTCNFKLFYNSDRTLEVRYTIGGIPAVSQEILYEILKDEKKLCSFSADLYVASAVDETDANGIAGVKVANNKQMEGNCQIKVSVLNEKDVSPLFFNIFVTPKGTIPLSVYLKYEGNYIINTVQAFLFKHNNKGDVKCSLGLEELLKKTASYSSPTEEPNSVIHFKYFKDLEKEKIQYYTIVGIGKFGGEVTSSIKAWGCNDSDGVVEWGKTGKTITIELKDLLPKIKGSYEIESSFDLVSGLPPNVATVIYTIIGFFQNPVGEIMLLVCKLTGEKLEEMCGWIFQDPNNPSLDKLTSKGEIVSNILNTFLVALLKTNCPYKENPQLCENIYWSGKDIGEMLKKFHLKSTFTFYEESKEDGIIPSSTTKEVWHTVIIKWTLGKDCPPNDKNCGKIPLSFSNIPGIDDVVSGKFEAKIEYLKEEKNFGITIKKHPLKLKYGAIVNFAIEKLLLPQIFGPIIDSYEEMIGSFLGGQECVQKLNCCEIFAENLTNQTSGLMKNVVEGACDALILTGAEFLRSLLLGLDYEGENFTIGTLSPCLIYDKMKNDMKFDTFGDYINPCKWDATLKIGNVEYKPSGTFVGVEQQ